jgi:glycosyltransferase involved in cell wall biosynthesis
MPASGLRGATVASLEKALCLNMIVKNEMANLDRCLRSVADHIACWVICDTGSSDGTQKFIRDFFAERNIPGELHSFPFIDFAQARNAALDCAYASSLAYDYLLLTDADMELIVEDKEFRAKLGAPYYDVLQRSDISYWNSRLVCRNARARYRGVTHEYLDVPHGDGQRLAGIWFKDHASGANRANKFERDIRLLRLGLKQEPENPRYWFYLAQSYKDAGRISEAAEAYAKRAAMGGWDEEAWYAQLQEARCLRDLKDEGGFLRCALAAFNQRPHRAEPLYDLARFYRERGMNEASALFAEAGLALRPPEGDVLFIEDFVYHAGLKEEYSIAAYYCKDPTRRKYGFAACHWLALNRDVPSQSRTLARQNLQFYVEPLEEIAPSLRARRISFAAPEGHHLTNPSVAQRGEEIVMIQRCVNFILSEDGQYSTPQGGPVNTRNFLVRLDANLDILSSSEIMHPEDFPPPAFDLVQGFEDSRLFAWRDALWCISTVRELTPEGRCEQVLARIDEDDPQFCRLVDWRVLRAEAPLQDEKNWMPLVAGETLRFIRLCDPTHVVDEAARTIAVTTPGVAADDFRGGSQAVAFEGGWLAIIHEVLAGAHEGQRIYHHRFVWFDAANALGAVSRPFYFHRKGVEFAAGLAWHPDGRRLLISYGVADCEAWLGTVDPGEIRAALIACADMAAA